MNVSQTSGSSAAWMLQRLFQSPDETSTATTAESAGLQKMPGAEGHKCNSGGASLPAMSSRIMSAMVSMQMKAPSASDIASDMISSLDTDGEGEVSAEEITAAFSSAGFDTGGISDAIDEIDTDASGALSADELTTAISSDMQAHGPKGPPLGGPPPGGPPPGGPPPGGPPPGGMGPRADDAASSSLSAFDSDADSRLSLDEILSALGQEGDEDGGVASALSSLDSDSDGNRSLAELKAGIQQDMDAGYRAYAEQAAQQA